MEKVLTTVIRTPKFAIALPSLRIAHVTCCAEISLHTLAPCPKQVLGRQMAIEGREARCTRAGCWRLSPLCGDTGTLATRD